MVRRGSPVRVRQRAWLGQAVPRTCLRAGTGPTNGRVSARGSAQGESPANRHSSPTESDRGLLSEVVPGAVWTHHRTSWLCVKSSLEGSGRGNLPTSYPRTRRFARASSRQPRKSGLTLDEPGTATAIDVRCPQGRGDNGFARASESLHLGLTTLEQSRTPRRLLAAAFRASAEWTIRAELLTASFIGIVLPCHVIACRAMNHERSRRTTV